MMSCLQRHDRQTSLRCGLHIGEIDLVNGTIQGLAVDVAKQIVKLAPPGSVVISRTVKDLVAGSGITLDDLGTFAIEGVEEKWQLHRANV